MSSFIKRDSIINNVKYIRYNNGKYIFHTDVFGSSSNTHYLYLYTGDGIEGCEPLLYCTAGRRYLKRFCDAIPRVILADQCLLGQEDSLTIRREYGI